MMSVSDFWYSLPNAKNSREGEGGGTSLPFPMLSLTFGIMGSSSSFSS